MSLGDTPDSMNPYQSPRLDSSMPDGLTPSVRTADLLRQTRPWVRLLGILGFIAVSMLLLVFLFTLVAGILGLAADGVGRGGVQLISTLAMIGATSLLGILPPLFLLRYASRITTFLEDGRVESLDAALEAQKSFWKTVGIVIAIVLGFYALAIALALVGMSLSFVA